MNQMIKIAPVKKSVVVEASAAHAFETFTAGIDRWWPKRMGVDAEPIKQSIIEPFVGGRWYTKRENGTDITVGHVLKWSPGEIFAVTWEVNGKFGSGPEANFASDVEVRFIAETGQRTRVELEHRNFERLGEEAGEKMRGNVEGGWPHMLALFAEEAAK
jgi:uncharacterized protein YndB with AHSA1/START domain